MGLSASDQIIAVINDLCQRFGIAMDWSSENVLPFLEDICKRFIQFEIYTSIAWCVASAVVIVVSGISWVISGSVHEKTSSTTSGTIRDTAMAFFWCSLIIGGIILLVQAFDVIECLTLPEKTILDYITGMMESNKN